MTAASNPTPQPQVTGQLSRGWIAFILAVVFGSLGLWSVCAGVAYFALNGTPTVWNPVPPGTNILGTKSSPMDWWTSRVLSQVYTVALDQVVADEEVIELLGEPIEVDYAAEDLFSRKGTGNLNPSEEAIAFDIKGSKQSAIVTVLAATPEQQLKILEIRVTAEDGQAIFVDPPENAQITIR